MLYRDIKEDDIEEIYNLYKSEGWGTYTKDLINRLVTKSRWVIAEEDNNIYGLARYLSDDVLSIYLCEIIVSKMFRGQGIGKSLIMEIFNRNANLRIDLLSDNDEFYKKLKFRELGTAFRAYGIEIK